MSEQQYKKEHLKSYRGILTSEFENNGFKMELKAEDNLVLQERSTIESSIELDFEYKFYESTEFFHELRLCQTEGCPECKEVGKKFYRFESNLKELQLGDTFEISAALISDGESALPQEIGNFKAYSPLIVAYYGDYEGSLRLPDTIEGINKKREYMEQKEREVEEEEEEAKRLKKLHEKPFFEKLLDKLSPYLPEWLVKGVIVTVIGGVIVGIILLVFGESIKEIILAIFR